ncbi:MAG: 3-ketoacyl-ACP reductase FabG2 [Woeseiaceae bacterium]|jgi:3-oxoacyl-[acyl-carrier protein] reductase
MSRTVLVTGASKGIGQAIAERLAADGFDIVVHYHSDRDGADATARAVEAAGAGARIMQFDASDREAVLQAIESDIGEHGAYYGVINNAGVSRDNAFPAMSDEDWDKVIDTNLDSFFNVIKPCVMPMVRARNGGRIITISSVSGVIGNRGQVNYSAAKAGVIGASKALALELGKRNITVNCVAPGFIETAMTTDVELEHIMKMIPARRAGQVREVAALVSYLMSDAAGYVTRQTICIDGGLS